MRLSTITISHYDLKKNTVLGLKKLSAEYFSIDSDDKDLVKECNRFFEKCNHDIILTSTNISSKEILVLQKILNISERHAAVSPRGNNLGLISFPASQDIVEKMGDFKKLHEDVKDLLAEYSIAPYLSANCIVISNRLLKKFGGFDDNIASIDDAIIDWCVKVGKLGYSSIVANRVLVDNFRLPKHDFDFNRRYPFIDKLVKKFLKEEVSAIEKFLPILNEKKSKPKVLLSLYQLAPLYNGTAEHGLSMVEKLIENYSHKYEFHILIDNINAHFFKLDKKYKKIMNEYEIKDVYYLGITFIQITDLNLLSILNRHCLNIIQTVLDLINYRSISMSYWTDTRVLKTAISYSDAVITISNTVKKDIVAAFPCMKDKVSRKIKPVLITKVEKNIHHTTDFKEKIPFEKYILIFGNHYDHKVLHFVYPILKTISHNFIIVGAKKKEISGNVKSFSSGGLSEEFIDYLYKNCDALLFPSEYEGYGLPIINALVYGKSVIVSDTEINYELHSYFKEFKSKFIFFDRYSELKSIIEKGAFRTDNNPKKLHRDYNDVVTETENILSQVIHSKTDFKKIIERDTTVSFIPDSSKTILQKLKIYLKINYPTIALFLRKIKSKLTTLLINNV